MRYCFLIILLFATAAFGSLDGVNPGAEQQPYRILRTVTSNDTALTASTKTWTNIKSTFIPIQPSWEYASITFLAYGDGDGAGDPNQGSFSFKVFTCRQYGSAQQVCTGTATIGELEASHNPQTWQTATDTKWAELPTVTSTWRIPVKAAGTTDDIGSVNLATTGEFGIYVEITSLTNISTLYVLGTGYKNVVSVNDAGTVTITGTVTGPLTDTELRASDVSVTLTSPTKTSTINVVDAWQSVTAGTAVVGSVGDLSDAYGDSILYVEVAQIEATAHAGGSGPIVQVSYTDDNWVDLVTLSLTADTAATTTTVGAVTDANTVIDLTDASTGDFDVVARKWFIKDGTISNSETVYTVSETGNAVTIASGCVRSHASGVSVYDRVDDFAVSIPEGVTKVRMLWNNTDADCDIAVTSRLNKTTAR